MINVLLIHAGIIPHYRIPVYDNLSNYLKNHGFNLMVISDGIQADKIDTINFKYHQMTLSTMSILRFVYKQKINVIIDFMELKHRFLFPTYFFVKWLFRRKMIYWGQGRDLLDKDAKIKNLLYACEQAMCDAIILYAEHLKKYIPKKFHKKTFIANNTLFIDYTGLPARMTKEKILDEYGIKTRKNIICMGRMQKRKRVDHIVKALELMNKTDIGLILVGPDPEGVMDNITGNNIYKLGPIYGKNRFDLLSAADVYCLPGAVGLSIIDAFYCGLPFITENGDESAEMMYLKDSVNGFIVPRDNIEELTRKLLLLLNNGQLRERFSLAAKQGITKNGDTNKMFAGFRDALFYATKKISVI